MPPLSKVLRDGQSTVNPMTFVTLAMLTNVVSDWHTKLTAVSGHLRSNDEKTTKDMMHVGQQIMMMMNMLRAYENALAELKSRLAVLEDHAGATNQDTPSPTVSSPMCHSPLSKRSKFAQDVDSEEDIYKLLEQFITPMYEEYEEQLIAGGAEKAANGQVAANGQLAANEAAAAAEVAAEAAAKANAAHMVEVEKKARRDAMELLNLETPGHKVPMTGDIVNGLLELSPAEFVKSVKKMVENNQITTDQGENLMHIFVNSPRRKLPRVLFDQE